MRIREIWDMVLQDDGTPYGGVSFAGETVGDFAESVGLDGTASIAALDYWLIKSGIKPISLD
jgi:hypothetical protein